MKKSLIKHLTLIFIFTAASVFAQEKEYELSSNPVLFSKTARASNALKTAVTNKRFTIFLKDTIALALPFLDDFSSNKFTSYDTADYDASAKSDSVRYSFTVNNFLVDTLSYITDTAYKYSYNTTTQSIDSVKVATPDYVLRFYDDQVHPSKVSSSMNAWVPYFKPNYDSTGNYTDSNLVKLFTTKILEIDSILFVNTHIFPIQTLWYENQVYVNSTFPLNPPTIGVATFEGLDSTGYPYKFSNPASYGPADILTSKYLDLSVPLGTNDSIQLSFFYQPKGIGNYPEPSDSLILDFKKQDGSWGHVWSKPGQDLVFNDTLFRKVEIRIKDASYLFNGFQFRFKNYATLSGNVDHWHIDYVKLKKYTFASDTIVRDLAFVYPAESMLNEFQAIPFSQFSPSMMKSNVKNTIVNLNSVTENFGSYKYTVMDNDNNFIFQSPPSGSQNILPSSQGNFSFAPVTNPAVGFVFPDTTVCKDFSIIHKIQIAGSASVDQINTNDSIQFVQHFTDYYAYDDASAESAYGVVQPGGMVGEKFTLTNPDTMNAVYIYFNPSVDDASNKIFKLVIWSDGGSGPGAVVYQSSAAYSPSYAHLINGFLKYELDAPVALSGTFYVGWIQSTANELNVGLDKNNNHGDKIYYNIGSGWNQSILNGSLMLHPVFKSCPFLYIGITEKNKIEKEALEVYPNPASDHLFLKTDKPYEASIYIHDLTGKIIFAKQQNTAQSIDISTVPGGIYFIRIENKLLGSFTNKKIIVIK